MANPFLFMEDESAAVGADSANDAFSNPFLVDDDAEGEQFTGDNPFFSGPNNPFSFGETDNDGNQVMAPASTDASLFMTEDPNSNEQQIDHTMTFFGTTINENDGLQYTKPSDLNIQNQTALFDDPMNAYSSDDELKLKKVPPRPNIPPSHVTQQLISNITDQLDQTSTHLLGRLPVTRTPSPVSMRDFQSPSPTPDNVIDLLDVSEQPVDPSNQTQNDMFGFHNDANSFMPVSSVPTTIADENNYVSENPFAATTQTITQTQAPKPNRPPPPRPIPPRPTPPKGMSPVTAPTPVSTINTATVAQSQVHQEQDQDLFDFFGVGAKKPPPKPPAPKTKEDILSLFSAPPPTAKPVVNQQPDLLCDDLDFGMAPVTDANMTAPQSMNTFTQPATAPSVPPVIPPQPVQAAVQPQAVIDDISIAPVVAQEIPNAPIENNFSPNEVEQEVATTVLPVVENDVNVNEIIETASEEIDHADEIMIIRPDIPQIEETLCKSLPPSSEASPTEPYAPTSYQMPDSNMQEDVSEPAAAEIDTQIQSIPEQFPYSPEIDYAPQTVDMANPFAIEESYNEPVEVPTNVFSQPAVQAMPVDISTNAFAQPAVQAMPVDVPANVFTQPAVQAMPVDVPANVFTQPAVQAMPIEEPIFAPVVQQQPMESAMNDIFGTAIKQEQPQKPKPPPPPVRSYHAPAPEVKQADDFDDFSAKFESKVQAKPTGNAFLDSFGAPPVSNDAWGDSVVIPTDVSDGFGNDDDGFDTWNVPPAAPGSTPFERRGSKDSDEGNKEFNVFIRPKEANSSYGAAPVLAPPPQRSPQTGSIYSGDSSERVNPFDKGYDDEPVEQLPGLQRTGSQDSGPPTPLFDDDVSQPLEDFPRIFYHGDGWEMQLRQPNKKKITGQRFWKKIWVRLVYQGDNPVIQLLNSATDKDPFQELPLQACYSVSDISAQQYDNFGKIFTIKLQYVFYKERPGLRPGQITKAERITNKLSQFAAYAIQGDYQGVKEFGSDLKKLGLPVANAPQISELFKLGSMNYEDLKQFSMCVEEALFKLNVHRDRALTYKLEEVQLTVVDELYVEQHADGTVMKQIARVRLYFLGFLSGMPDIELGVNDLWRQGKEVVGRHDIIPVVTEEWIRLEGVEFHSCVQLDEYERTRTIKFKPPDACYIELMRFRVRPPKNRELPLQLKAQWVVTGNKVQLRADVLVPGFASRKLGQIPCEDVSIRFPIPECWIYLFRVEKHFKYGSVKSTHRRTGKIKGIERLLGTVETLQESLIEVTSGQAKYEHQHRAIVWRCPRLPKEGQGAYTTHQLVCRLALTSFDQIPEQLAPYAYIEFTMPATTMSHTTVRSVSVQESDSDEPPEKYVRYLARMEFRVGIESTQGESMNPYLAATSVTPKPAPTTHVEEQPMSTTPTAPSDSDSDSN